MGARVQWVQWLKSYGAGNFYDAFMRTAQEARGTCTQCKADIYLDIREGGGVPDWRTAGGDYGCDESPDASDDRAGSHRPEKWDGHSGA